MYCMYCTCTVHTTDSIYKISNPPNALGLENGTSYWVDIFEIMARKAKNQLINYSNMIAIY